MKKFVNPDELSFRQITPPMILESLLRITVGVVNGVFLSKIDGSAVSAVGITNQYIMMCQIVATAVATGTVVCLNQAIGMKNQRNANKYASIALFANLVMGLLFGLLFFFFTTPFLKIMTFGSDGIRLMAETYMRIVGTSMAIQCLQIIISNINRSMGKTRAPLYTNLTINGINILGCALVVNGHIFTNLDPIQGVAIVNVTSQVVGLAVAAVIMRTTAISISIKNMFPFPWKDIKLALSIGIPAGLNNIAYSASQIVTSSIISQTSQIMLDAKSYISSVVSYVALVGMAFAHSAPLLIGYKLGAGDIEGVNRIRARVTRIALISNAICSVLLILSHKFIFSALYGDVEQIETIIKIASTIVIIDFVVEMGRALNNTLSGSLQATGDVMFQLVVNQASGWLVAVGGAYLFGIVLGLDLYGIWIAFALDECTRGLILLYRWRSQKWVAKAKQRTKTIAA